MTVSSKMKKLTEENAILLSNSIDTVFFDIDGVLWNVLGVLPKAKELINKLKEVGKRVFFVTNNNGKVRSKLLEKFHKNSFDVEIEEVLSSSFLIATYVKNILKLDEKKKKVYMIGSKGIGDELDLLGIDHIGLGPREIVEAEDDYVSCIQFKRDHDVGAVVAGYDKYFCMTKVCEAMNYLSDPLIPFVAANLDNAYPVGNNILAPGTGISIGAVKMAAKREPIIVGKPSKMFLDIIQTNHKITPETTLMVGDRLNTDIEFGRACGFKTLCVLTGVTNENQLKDVEKNGNPKHVPHYYSEDLTTFYDSLCC